MALGREHASAKKHKQNIRNMRKHNLIERGTNSLFDHWGTMEAINTTITQFYDIQLKC